MLGKWFRKRMGGGSGLSFALPLSNKDTIIFSLLDICINFGMVRARNYCELDRSTNRSLCREPWKIMLKTMLCRFNSFSGQRLAKSMTLLATVLKNPTAGKL